MGGTHSKPLSIISPRYRAPRKKESVLTFVTLANGDFMIHNVTRGIKFEFIAQKVPQPFARHLWIIKDGDGNPIVTMKRKVWTAHSRWEVFRGDSEDSQNLIFTAKRHSVLDLKPKLDVFLANNTAEEVPDFEVEGICSKKSCKIYAGDRERSIAEKKENEQMVDKIFQGKSNFKVTVYPNVDRAFVVALIVIIKEIVPEFEFTPEMAVNIFKFTIVVANWSATLI